MAHKKEPKRLKPLVSFAILMALIVIMFLGYLFIKSR